MSLVLQKRRQQPSGRVRVNFAHPVARGIVGAFSAASPGINLATGYGAITVTGSPSIVGSPVGKGYKALGASDYFTLPDLTGVLNTGAATALFVMVGGESSGNHGFGNYDNDFTGTSHYPGFGAIYLSTLANTRWANGVQPVVDLTQPHVLVIRSRASDQVGTQNGIVFATGAQAATAFIESNATIGWDATGGGFKYPGNKPLLIFWNRYLSTNEVIEISANITRPWQLFQPELQNIYLVSAGTSAYNLTASAGSYALTGVASSLLYGRLLSAAKGTYTYTGVAAGTYYGRTVTAAKGTFTLTGQSNSLLWGHVIAIGKGTFTLNGQDATLVYNPVAGAYTLTAATGSFSLTGKDAGLYFGRVISVAKGTFSLTGKDAGTLVGRKVTASAGSFALTGVAANLRHGYVLTTDTGVYLLTGKNASLIYSGATGNTVQFFQGISHPTQDEGGVSLTIHELTPAGGGTYIVVRKSGVSKDKTDAVTYEGYIIS